MDERAITIHWLRHNCGRLHTTSCISVHSLCACGGLLWPTLISAMEA